MYFYLVIPLGGRLCIACLCLFVGLGNLFQGLAVLFNQYIKLIHILLIAVERIVEGILGFPLPHTAQIQFMGLQIVHLVFELTVVLAKLVSRLSHLCRCNSDLCHNFCPPWIYIELTCYSPD